MAGERRLLTLCGKGSLLSSASVFEFSAATPRMLIRFDPSALTRLTSSSSGNKSDSTKSSFDIKLSLPDYLTPEEARASIVVLLYKLVRGGTSFSAAALTHLLDVLNTHAQTLTITLDFERQEDIDLLRNCWSDIIVTGICALLDYTASSLSTVADIVAALSCEALKADTSTFNLFTDSGDGSADKDRASVANDFKVLLNGSNMSSNVQFDQVFNIPRVHGCLRSVCKSARSLIRAELNYIPLVNRSASNDLASLLASLVFALQDLGESSLLRAVHCLEGLVKDNTYPNLVESFYAGCPNLDQLESAVLSFSRSKFQKSYIKSLHEINSLIEAVRKIICWEATLSFITLEERASKDYKNGEVQVDTDRVKTKSGKLDKKKNAETSELKENKHVGKKGQGDTEGVNIQSKKLDKEKNSEKYGVHKKKTNNVIMGKGTTVLMRFIKDNFPAVTSNTAALVEEVSQGFLSFFDLKDRGLDHLLHKFKEIVDSNDGRRLPKIPKGTRDFAKEQMSVREKAFSIVTNVFKRHCATELETPVFELREILTGKYGEDSKLIYDLADQGGELCSLRYDLTVPFARYVAMNGITSYRRYQIAKVYRRDNPSKGRYREFYQCDFDVAGDATVEVEFEVVHILIELLDDLNIGDYEIKLNHRKLLDGMLEICGVPSHKFQTVCSSIDKLDKQTFEQIRMELIEDKGLDVETVEKLGLFVVLSGHPLELLTELKKDGSEFLQNDSSAQALNNLEKLFQHLDNSKCLNKVVLDLSLARGLDYYTGVIFEAVFKGVTQVGSIAAGGRYDNLIAKFGSKHNVAAIGVSLGIERVFTIMEQNQKEKQLLRENETQVLVSMFGDDSFAATKLAAMCWVANLKAKFMVHKRDNKHFEHVKKYGIPWMVIVGDRYTKEGHVKIKDIENNADHENVPVSSFVDKLITLMNTPNPK